jgi:hypothetical protein
MLPATDRSAGIDFDDVAFQWRHLQDLLASGAPKVDQPFFRLAESIDQVAMGKAWDQIHSLDDEPLAINVKLDLSAFADLHLLGNGRGYAKR